MNYFIQNRTVKKVQKYISLLSICYLALLPGYSQTINPEFGEVNISADNFVSGVTRRGFVDVQKSTGKTVYVYTEKDADPATTKDIWCVIYNTDMTVLVSPFRVNTTTTNDQLYPTAIVHQNDNSFFVTWSGNQNGGSLDVYVKKISFEITNATAAAVVSTPDILVNDIVTGEQGASLMTIGYITNELLIGFRDQSGNDGGGTGSQGVYVKRMNPTTLASIGTQFLIHTNVSGNQVLNAMEMKGFKLVVSYNTNHVTANAHDIFVSIIWFSMRGDGKVSYDLDSEYRVNNYLTGDQNNSHLAMNETSGEFVVTWSSSQDGSGFGVYAKIYNLDQGTVVKDEFLVNSLTTNNQLLSKAVWEESTRQLMFFFHYSLSGLGTLMYRIFDGATIPGQYTAVDVERNLIGGADTKSYYNQNYNVVYNSYTNRLNLVYDVYDSYTTYNSKLKARTYFFKHPNLTTPYFVNSTDLDRNWIHTLSYAEDGSLKAEARQYTDSLANPVQSQVRNVAEGKILVSMPVYDIFTRPVLQTLSAPITEQLFTYKNDFIFPVGGYAKYSSADFDKPVTAGNVSGEVNNPKAVNPASLLGKYYSDNNTYESYVAATAFPYSRSFHNDVVTGGVVSSTSAGEALKMGSGHEVKLVELPILNELDHYLKWKKNYFGASDITATTLAFKGIKTISIDQNGVESIAFKDNNGFMIASAKASGASNMAMQAKLSASISYYNFSASPYVVISDITVSSSSALIEVWDLCSNTLIFSGYENDFNVLGNAYNCNFQIRSVNPFKVSYTTTNNHSIVNRYSNQASSDLIGNSVVDLYLKDPASLSLAFNDTYSSVYGTLGIKVINLSNGAVLYNGAHSSFSNSQLPAGAGFYRIQLESLPVAYDYDSATFNLKATFSFPYSDFAYYFYDLKGKIVSSVAPNGVVMSSTTLPEFKTEYTYSSLGRILSTKDPDNGLKEYVYRKDGQIRFQQDAQQRASGKFSYRNPDNLGRITESGEYNPALVLSNAKVFISHRTQETTTPVNPNSVHSLLENNASGGGLESAGRTQVMYVLYDTPAFDALRTQRYTRQKKSATYRKNLDADASYVCKSWYSYDERGRLEWLDQTLTGLGNKTIDYTYTRELLTNVIYQKNIVAERFEHKNTYDAMQRLKKVETAAGAALYQTEAQYYYYLHGPLKRKELGNNVQGIDYVYTAQGWLKSINHPELAPAKDPGHDGAVGSSFSKDVFGMSFDYYNNDYTRTNSSVSSTTGSSLNAYAQNFNGILRAIQWQTSGQGISGNPAQYAYAYDTKYQMVNATFGTNDISSQNFLADVNNKYKTTASYDPNGNLAELNTNKGAMPADHYSYNYSDANADNKLSILINSANTNDSRTYQYDGTGQMINETRSTGKQKRVTYDVYGRVSEVRDSSNALVASFVYNEHGYRIKKTTYSAGAASFTTWYLPDAAGNVVSIYDNKSGSIGQTEIPIFGADREGVVQKSNNTLVYTYELKDHLGNVRATVDRVKQGNGDATLMSWADYLPFGEMNPERRSFSAYARRYECQGEYAEYDGETDWNAFELRMYDSRIGRWLSTDPYAQHWSPYTAMSNNPANSVDPDGGYAIDVAMNGHPDSYMNPMTGVSTMTMNNGKAAVYDYQQYMWVMLLDDVEVVGTRDKNDVKVVVASPGSGQEGPVNISDASVWKWFTMKGGFVFTSKSSVEGASEAHVRDRAKGVGAVRVVNVDNITTVFNSVEKSKDASRAEKLLLLLGNLHNATDIIEKNRPASLDFRTIDTIYRSPNSATIRAIDVSVGDTVKLGILNLSTTDSTYGTR